MVTTMLPPRTVAGTMFIVTATVPMPSAFNEMAELNVTTGVQSVRCVPRLDTLSNAYWVHSVASVGKGQLVGGSVKTPLQTLKFLTKVLFNVVKLPLVHAVPGLQPMLPTISTKPAGATL